MSMSQCCLSPDIFEDFQTGDSVCRNCGACCHNIMLDSFGNQPASEEHAFTLVEDQKGKKMREILEQVLQALGISDAFLETAFRMVDEVYQGGKSLRGTDLTHLCIAIAKRISDDNNLSFDSCKVEDAYGKKIMTRIEKLLYDYLPFQKFRANEDNSETHRTLRLQNFVLKTAHELNYQNPMISTRLVRDLCSVPKSTKVKSTVALYIMDPSKLKQLSHHFKTSKDRIRSSLKDIERFINVNYGILDAEELKTRKEKERVKAESKAKAKIEKAKAREERERMKVESKVKAKIEKAIAREERERMKVESKAEIKKARAILKAEKKTETRKSKKRVFGELTNVI